MHFTEKTVSSKVAYEGRIITVREDTARLDSGKDVYREVVSHPGGVAVIPIEKNSDVVTVRQFRYPFQTETIEVPAGKLEYGEDPHECAIRELSEETGISAAKIIDLGMIYPSPGFCSEVLYMYLALDLSYGTAHPDEDEFLNVERIPLSTLIDMIMNNELRDAKTVAAILKADKYIQTNGGFYGENRSDS